ncbi:hypothetical protein GCM10017600_57590 [Streptosporangium carneum]|uniref:Uncharacterized protein n=1 Tax=Streptosporangium carneum TaxID=47481 RepID=A0A9W6I7H7_9ACTN|nr:hypothetical protein GCM10017600_57590 [Streptosporangium carneum]
MSPKNPGYPVNHPVKSCFIGAPDILRFPGRTASPISCDKIQFFQELERIFGGPPRAGADGAPAHRTAARHVVDHGNRRTRLWHPRSNALPEFQRSLAAPGAGHAFNLRIPRTTKRNTAAD